MEVREPDISKWTDREHVVRTASILAACILFAGAYYQSPLFSSNQNMYFLHGMARAGFGHLASDWLAQQTDHVPVFGAIVTLVYKLDSHWLYYAILGVLATNYAVSLLVITTRPSLADVRMHQLAVFFALLTLIHSPWILGPFMDMFPSLSLVIPQLQRIATLSTNGVAEQYILGSYLQPSAFGVLLITSVAFFVSRKGYMAIVFAVFAATINPTYILHAAILTGAYMKVLLSERHGRKARNVGALAILLILPSVMYVVLELNLTDNLTLSTAQAILVEERLPHHAKISTWFSNSSYIQLAIVLVGIWLSRNQKRLFHVLLSCSIVTIVLTMLQMVTSNQALALLFPWRLSAWLVPMCAAVVLANISIAAANLLDSISNHRFRGYVRTAAISLAVMFLASACNLGIKNTLEDATTDRHQGTVLSYAKIHSAPGQTYLIPLDLQEFRLVTGLPAFVDWKSIPYRPSELVEWYERVQIAREYYEALTTADAIAALGAINKHTGITHVIVEVESDVLHAAMHARDEFRDNTHVIYELRNP